MIRLLRKLFRLLRRPGFDWNPPERKPPMRHRDDDEYADYLAAGGSQYSCKEAWEEAV
jgi:hypothetical protein